MMKATSRDFVSGCLASVLTFCFLVPLLSGCASYRARKHLEGVARGWCETIRASQVIPVYPLTEDLVPGDVFLVQVTIESQARLYRERGFLALDDHRTRLSPLDFKKVYFDGYWKDEFGTTPHEKTTRSNAGPLPAGSAPTSQLTTASAPRAAFPTYSFAAQSGFGLSLALPIHGVPVGLNYLRTDRVNGSVTIADARTYAGDEQQLYELLTRWVDDTTVRQILTDTVKNSCGRPVFLRVVTRVYLAGAVVVSLNRADASGARLEAGKAPPVTMISPDGTVSQNYANLLAELNKQSNPITALADAGGGVKYLGASESSVSLAESFDRSLVIGYLGFDVPVYPGGDLGVPIPTFQHLTGQVSALPTVVGELTDSQKRARVSLDALESLLKESPEQGLIVIASVIHQIRVKELAAARRAYDSLQKEKNPECKQPYIDVLLNQFKLGVTAYVSRQGSSGPNYAHFEDVFIRAYDERDRQP